MVKPEKYLVDYIEHELPYDLVPMPHLQEIIKQGLDAFESTEGVKIITKKLVCTDCPNKNELVEFLCKLCGR